MPIKGPLGAPLQFRGVDVWGGANGFSDHLRGKEIILLATIWVFDLI